MATIVRDIRSNEHFILLSASFHIWKDTHAGFFGRLDETGAVASVAVTDRTGQVRFFEAQHIEVVTVDGMAPGALLDWKKSPEPAGVQGTPAQTRSYTVPTMDDVEQVTVDICPSCGAGVLSTERICPSCDLTLRLDEDETS